MPDKNYYWTETTEQKVKQFVENDSLQKWQRDKIYREHLHEPIQEMIKAIIHTFEIYNTEHGNNLNDLISDTTCRVYEVLDQSRKEKYYNPSEGKAFSYFSVVVKFYLIGKENEYRDKQVMVKSLSDEESFIEPSTNPEQPIHQNINYKDFYNKLMSWISANGEDLFVEERNREIASAVVNTMQNRMHLLSGDKSFKEDVEEQLQSEKQPNFDSKYYRVKAIINKAFRGLKRVYSDQGTITKDLVL